MLEGSALGPIKVNDNQEIFTMLVCARCKQNLQTFRDICDFSKQDLSITKGDKNFLGTYLTENGSTAVVVSKSAMVIGGKKEIIWVGFIWPSITLAIWDSEGKSLNMRPITQTSFAHMWNLKEAIRETAY